MFHCYQLTIWKFSSSSEEAKATWPASVPVLQSCHFLLSKMLVLVNILACVSTVFKRNKMRELLFQVLLV
jgi:hypothetical protein